MTTNEEYEIRDIDGDGRPYMVLPSQLVEIEDHDYVRCPLHGLMPLEHYCVKAPFDHWCREAAHPQFTGVNDDQGCTSRDWATILTAQRDYWYKVAQRAAEALRVADLYLDGFVWISEPEFSELRAIKRRSKKAQRWASFPPTGPELVTKRAVPHLYAAGESDH